MAVCVAISTSARRLPAACLLFVRLFSTSQLNLPTNDQQPCTSLVVPVHCCVCVCVCACVWACAQGRSAQAIRGAIRRALVKEGTQLSATSSLLDRSPERLAGFSSRLRGSMQQALMYENKALQVGTARRRVLRTA